MDRRSQLTHAAYGTRAFCALSRCAVGWLPAVLALLRSVRHPRPSMAALALCRMLLIFMASAAAVAGEHVARVDCDLPPTRLYWDNVEGAPIWIAGCRPKLRPSLGMHVVRLAPGAQVRILAPAREMVRVVNPRGVLQPDDAEIWVSNGTGVLRLHRAAVTEQGHSLVASPDLAHPAVVSIERPRDAACDIELAIFVSRTEFPTDAEPACELAIAGCQPLRLVREPDHQVEHFAGLAGGGWYAIDDAVRGPLVIETRLRYPPLEMRREQSYQLQVKYDGRLARVIDFETTPETQHLLNLQGCAAVLGRLQTDYLCLPSGVKRVHIGSTADVLVRVRRCFSCSCGNSLGAPPAPCGPACLVRSFPWPDKISLWDLQEHEIGAAFLGQTGRGAPTALLRRIARDNAHRAGGLSSTLLARGQTASWSGHPRWRALTDDLAGMHTGFRHVLPSLKGRQRDLQFAWFTQRQPRRPGQAVDQQVVAAAHVDDVLGRYLSSGYFTVLPTLGETPLTFHVPREDRPSWLRLAFDRRRQQEPVVVFVQLGDGEPIPVRVQPGPDLPPGAYDPALGETGLAALHATHSVTDLGTLGGPFAQRQTPALQFPAGTTELLAPRDVAVVRVWSHTPTELSVALQYRLSNVHQLSERSYLELMQGAGPSQVGSRAFWDAMTDKLVDSDAPYETRELRNHWQPLMRLLRDHERNFAAGVTKPEERGGIEQLPPPELGDWIAQARDFAARQRWLDAVEKWSLVVTHGAGPQRVEAVAGQLRGLLELGEHGLLDRTARGFLLHDASVDVRETARMFLHRLYSERQDGDALEALTATAALRDGEPSRIADLASALLAQSRFDFALLAAGSLPDDRQPPELVELVVRCAYQMRWWQVFRAHVARLESVPQRNFWTAHEMTQKGAYSQALEMFRQAGPLGHQYARHLEDGLEILQALRCPDVDSRAQAVFRWEDWWEQFPGERIWVEDDSLVDASPGGSLLYSIARDLTMRYHRALPREPLQLVVYGPAKLRITARPRHTAPDAAPLDDWLNVRAAGQHYVFPITSNSPSTGLRIVGEPRDVPGTAVQAIVALGRGRHEVLLNAETVELLVQAEIERPESPLPVLPPINRDTLETALAGQWKLYLDEVLAKRKTAAHIVDHHGAALAQPFVHAATTSSWDADRMLAGVPADLAARMALRSRGDLEWYRPAVLELAQSTFALDPYERLLAWQACGGFEAADAQLLDGPRALPASLRQAYLLATGRRADPRELTQPTADPVQALRNMALLAYEAEMNPHRRDELAVWGERIQLKHPGFAELASLSSRLSTTLRWELQERFSGSAGVFVNQLAAWTPESPALRVRQALARNLARDDHVLLGEDALLLASRDARPSILDVVLEPVAIAFDASADTTVAYEIDGRPAGRVEVSPYVAARFPIELTAGKHTVSWRMVDPKLGQMIRLAVRARPVGGTTAEVLGPQSERTYQLATLQQPLELTVDGPAILRVDEMRDGATSSRYMDVDGASRRISLVPSDGAARAAFRVFRTAHDPSRTRRYPWQAAAAPVPVSAPLVGPIDLPGTLADPGDVQLASYEQADEVNLLPLLPPDYPLHVVDDLDRQVLGAQEDGTWEFGTGWFYRRAFDESPEMGVDQFLQFHATHRLFVEERDMYLHNEAVFRTRDSSGPSGGLLHAGWWQNPSSPWILQWEVSTYTQRPVPVDSAVPREQEWAVDGRLRLSQHHDLGPCTFHIPSITAFARDRTMKDNPYGASQVDQDVFTTYKQDHPTGLRLADSFVWQQCSNRRWGVGPMLVTNEDMNPFSPDHYGVRLGVQQAISHIDFDVFYRYTRFRQDQDRPRDVDQHLMFADVHLYKWNVLGRRLEVATRLRYDLVERLANGNIVFSWYFDRGRQYRDFPPTELRFWALRKQWAERDTAPWLLE